MSEIRTKGRKIKTKKLIFGAMFVFSLIFIMIAVSYSWFFNGNRGRAEGLSVEVMNANNLLVKSEDSEWVKRMTLSAPEGFNFQAVTGNGESFYSPKIELVEVGVSDSYSAWDYRVTGFEPIEESALSGNVFTYDLSFIIEEENELCLQNSKVEHGEDPNDPRGYASAALRVALQLKEGEEYRTVFIWIPDVMTKLDIDENNHVSITREQEREITFVNELGEEYQIAIEGEQGSSVIDGVNYVWGDITDPVYVAELGAMQEREVRLVIWVDGLDRDCENPLMSANVPVSLNFTAIEKQKVE